MDKTDIFGFWRHFDDTLTTRTFGAARYTPCLYNILCIKKLTHRIRCATYFSLCSLFLYHLWFDDISDDTGVQTWDGIRLFQSNSPSIICCIEVISVVLNRSENGSDAFMTTAIFRRDSSEISPVCSNRFNDPSLFLFPRWSLHRWTSLPACSGKRFALHFRANLT